MFKVFTSNNVSFNSYLIFSFFLLLIFSIILNIDFFISNVDDDEHTYLFIGRALNEGKLLYGDIVIFKGPLLFFFYKIYAFISGNDLFIFKLLGIMTNFIWLFIIFFIHLKKNRNLKSFFMILIATIILSFLPYDQNLLSENIANIFFSLILVILFKHRNKFDYLFIFICTAALISIRQNYVFILPAIFLIIFFETKYDFKKIFLYSLIQILIILIFFSYHLIFQTDDFIKLFYTFPRIWVGDSEINFIYIFEKIFEYILQSPIKNIFILLIMFFSLIIVIYKKKNFPKEFKYIFLISFFLFISLMISRHFFTHYLVMFYPMFFVILISFLKDLNKIFFYTFTIFFIVLGVYKFSNSSLNIKKNYEEMFKYEKEINILFEEKKYDKNHILSDERLIYYELNIYPPGRIFHMGHYDESKLIDLLFKEKKIKFLQDRIKNSEYVILNKKQQNITKSFTYVTFFSFDNDKSLIFENEKYLIYK